MQRFNNKFINFQKAFLNLQEVKFMQVNNYKFSNLEKEGIIQRFEIIIELSWKVIKEFLLEHGAIIAKSPKETILKAFEVDIINDKNAWITSLNFRNISSNTYDENLLDESVNFILNDFYNIVENLYKYLFNFVVK